MLVYVLARGFFVAQLVPPWQGPDEPTHYEYVRLAALERGAPSAFDPALQAAILDSMREEGFHAYLGADPGAPPAQRFDAEPRLRDAPSQLDSETPVGYLPFIPLAENAISRNLLSMRRISVLLSLAMVFFAYWGLHSALGPALALPGTALIALLPMLGFAGSMLNNDPSAAVLASLWWWMRIRGLGKARVTQGEARQAHSAKRSIVALIAVALLAGLAKRTAIHLLPLAILIGLADLYQQRRSRRTRIERVGSSNVGRIPLALFSLMILLILFAILRPHHERAAGWERAGDSWGDERRSDAARNGGWGLRIVDASPERWQYLERWQAIETGAPLTPDIQKGDRLTRGLAISASVWLRDASDAIPDLPTTPASRAQLVINDDAGGYWGETIELGPDWREARLDVTLSPAASRFRIALVPGDGTVEGTAALDADDLRLEVGEHEIEINGDAEAPYRAGSAIPGFLTRYLDPARLMAATRAGIREPMSTLSRAWTGLHFLFMSFWGGFGWLSVWPQGELYYRVAGAISFFTLVAWALALLRPRWLLEKTLQRSSAGSLAATSALGSPPATPTSPALDPTLQTRVLRECAIASALAIIIAIAGSMAGAPDRLPQGRYLLAALIPILLPAIVLAHRLLPRFGPWGLALLVLGLDLYALAWSLWPAYSGGPPT